MGVQTSAPIGCDDFRKLREKKLYFVDKSLFIRDYLSRKEEATLIMRPRRFGKTLNMSMVAEFLDITKDSRAIFEGLAIMETDFASQMNSAPVIRLTLKNCTGNDQEALRHAFVNAMFLEYYRYSEIFKGKGLESHPLFQNFYALWDLFLIEEEDIKVNKKASFTDLGNSLVNLMMAVGEYYHKRVYLFIDEYDTPIRSAQEKGTKEALSDFFSSFFGQALKGNANLQNALLTGIQSMSNEKFSTTANNLAVYTVISEYYSQYFGLTTKETSQLLEDFGLELNNKVKVQYECYLFGGTEIYNPWSILNYAQYKKLDSFWINTSTNSLISQSILAANEAFYDDYSDLLEFGEAEVILDLETSFTELNRSDTLWGFLVNTGYITVIQYECQSSRALVRIPNGELRKEFVKIVEKTSHLGENNLQLMFSHLLAQEMEEFILAYQKMVMKCTSFFHTNEIAYHQLFLGMSLSLTGLYEIRSELAAGKGCSDMRLTALDPAYMHIIIEFKSGSGPSKSEEAALQQILDKKYYTGLHGKVLCIGLAHNEKKCSVAHQVIDIP